MVVVVVIVIVHTVVNFEAGPFESHELDETINGIGVAVVVPQILALGTGPFDGKCRHGMIVLDLHANIVFGRIGA